MFISVHIYIMFIYITPSSFPISSLYCKCAGGACVGNDLAREGMLVAAKVADPVAPRGSGGRNVPLDGGLALTQNLLHKALVQPMEPDCRDSRCRYT